MDASAVPNEQTLAQAAGYTVTVVDQATWAGMTTAQFAAFDAVVVGDPSCIEGPDVLISVDESKAAWSPAITGPVYIQGTDPVWHGFIDDEPVPAAQILITEGINFAASGPGTGLYVSLSCYYAAASPDTSLDFLSAVGDFKVSGADATEAECVDAVTIVNPTHPAMAGLTSESLSNWSCSVHEFVTSFPSTFEVLAEAFRPSDGGSIPYIIASRPTIPIADAGLFVTQHYRDFLNRDPDASGLAFWTNEITLCGTDPGCIEAKRINVSAAFFLSIEFQQTGYLVYRIYKASYGDATDTSTFGGTHQLPVPVIRLNEFLPDTQQIGNGVIVNQSGWETVLENNKQAFTAEFVQRSRFTTAFPQSMTAAQFVDTLNANAGSPLSQSERDQLVSDLSSGAKTRGQVLRAVAEDQDLNNAEFNRAFVLMQYFGYLRRNPNDPQDTDYTGYDFWLTKLNQFNGNFVNAEMVKAFLVSTEYRQRFGQP
jgi:hypothetical protein